MLGFETTAADLSTKQFYAVKETSSGINVAGTLGENVIGILQDTPASGDPASVMAFGVSKAVASAAIAKGAMLTTANTGKVVTAGTGNNILGQALEAASGADQIITIMVLHRGVSA